MKCDLCGKMLYEREYFKIERRFFRKLVEGYICKICYENFHKFPNKIVYDGKKWWYISDPNLFGEASKLTFSPYSKMAFREFNGKRRIFVLKSKKFGEIRVSYYWVFKKGDPPKGPYFWDPGYENVFKNPKEVYKMLKMI
jgi:hypothetical protein